MRLLDRVLAFARRLRVDFFEVVSESTAPPHRAAPAAPAAPAAASEGNAPTPSAPITPPRRFVSPDALARLPRMSQREADQLPYGCVRVSDEGLVQLYNRWESEFAGVPQQAAVGVNFFRELAPCTNNRLIFGRFKEGVQTGELDTVVTYAFTYKMKPTLVDVHLYREPESGTNWILVRKAEPGK